jgi:uncharacterized protein YjiS (DUF1127 family)
LQRNKYCANANNLLLKTIFKGNFDTNFRRTIMVMLHTLLVRYNAWKLFRETRQELNALDDRMLADIGFSRCDIDRIAMEATAA